ncbi:MAG: hypothetical protein IJ068_05190 [Bacilli bacterium]|nr:hypothetical protein [Bacilli bacterium]
MKEKELKLINGQIIGILLFIISLLISLLIIYNEKLIKLNKPYFFTNHESLNITLINRILLVILGIYFVYDAIERKKLNNTDSNLQIIASLLALAASLVILYIIIINYNNIESNK